MPSARFFQQLLDILKQWWLSGFLINGQYALTDDRARRDLLRYCSAYASKPEPQERGTMHRHVLLWPVPTTGLYVELPRVTSRWLMTWDARRESESALTEHREH